MDLAGVRLFAGARLLITLVLDYRDSAGLYLFLVLHSWLESGVLSLWVPLKATNRSLQMFHFSCYSY